MSKIRSRKLRVESLEDRRVLTAGPITADIQLLMVDATTGGISTQDGTAVELNQHDAAQNGLTVPFVSGDFNDDGVTDLLAADNVGRWWLQLNDGTQLFELPVGLGSISKSWVRPTLTRTNCSTLRHSIRPRANCGFP